MNKKLSKKRIMKMIESQFTELTGDNIRSLIEAEILKGEEADTDYIDLCFELLTVKEKQSPEIQPVRRTVKPLLIAAAIIALLFSVITASAYVFDFSIPDLIAYIIDKDAHIDINLEYANTTAANYELSESELAKELEAHGITPVTIPEELLKDDCKIISIEYPETDTSVNIIARITFEYHGYYGRFTITQFVNDFNRKGYSIMKNIVSGQMIKVNGMDILIFEREKNCSVRYKDNLTEYNIYLEGDKETIINIVNSIK